MFEDRSLRIVASSILWSTGFVFLSVATHARLYGIDLASENIGYMRSLARCIIIGSFVGIPCGIILNAGVRPMRRNIAAAVGAVAGVAFTPLFAEMSHNWGGEAWQRCLPFTFLTCFITGIGMLLFETARKKMTPEGAKLKD
jgi:drug/metabolite transporter (DMT)-like permease